MMMLLIYEYHFIKLKVSFHVLAIYSNSVL